MQPAGERQGTVLHIEGEVVDVKAAGSHHLEGLVVLDLTMMLDIHIRDIWGLPHVHTGQGRRVSLGLKSRLSPGSPKVPEPPSRERNSGRAKASGQFCLDSVFLTFLPILDNVWLLAIYS